MTFKGKSQAFLCGSASIIIADLLADSEDKDNRKIANEWLEGYRLNKYSNKNTP
jgi:hypothetical protein